MLFRKKILPYVLQYDFFGDYVEEKSINKIEEIVDEFIIGFSKFLETQCIKTEYLHQYIYKGKECHLTYLLEIYKNL